jgi:hypothetical protein
MRFVPVVLAILLAAAPFSLRAEGGRIEINAACASAGCFAGDSPGYPVSITQPGSYMLTSDLVLPAGVSGITLLTDDVHIDLNNFAIRGPATCAPGACSQSASPRLVGVGRPTFGTGQGKRCSVRNGAIIGIDGNGVALTNASQVSHVQVASVTLTGIEMSGTNALVERSTIDSVGAAGILIAGGLPGHPAVVRDNVLTNTSLAIAGPAIAGVRTGGSGNECDDGSCTQFRRYYLTKTTVEGGPAALSACSAGFHMAEIWEIHELSGLSYDTSLGQAADDSGHGPPTGLQGWIRTGSPEDSGVFNSPGLENCGAWTGGQQGTTAKLVEQTPLNSSGSDLSWGFRDDLCSNGIRVWCVED